MSVIVRSFTPADTAAVLAIDRAAYPHEAWSAGRFEAFSTLVAETDGQVVGFACHSVNHHAPDRDETLLLANLAVAPEHRRRGIGQTLLEAQMRIGARARVGKAMAIVAESEQALRALHRRYGFHEGPMLPNYYDSRREDGVVLARALDPEAEPPWRDEPSTAEPATVAQRFAEAERLAENGEPERALEVLEPLVHDQDAAMWARGWRAGLLDTVGRPVEATVEMERLVAETGAPFFHQALGDHYLCAGLVDTAVTHLLAAVPINTVQPNPRLWSSLGIAWERLERHREAAWAYERLLRDEQQNGWAYGRLAYVSLRMGRPTRAIELLEAGLKLDPDSADLHKTRGLALWTLGRHQEARHALRRALELDAENTEIAAQLGALEAEVELPRL